MFGLSHNLSQSQALEAKLKQLYKSKFLPDRYSHTVGEQRCRCAQETQRMSALRQTLDWNGNRSVAVEKLECGFECSVCINPRKGKLLICHRCELCTKQPQNFTCQPSTKGVHFASVFQVDDLS